MRLLVGHRLQVLLDLANVLLESSVDLVNIFRLGRLETTLRHVKRVLLRDSGESPGGVGM
jgi:hypothetical protein